MAHIKNRKTAGSDGLPAELFKAGADKLIRVHASTYLQDMANRKQGHRVEPERVMSCVEERRPL